MTTIRPRDIPRTLRKMSTEDVAAWNESFKEGSANRILGDLELKRRRDSAITMRSWIAIGISVVALIVSFIALYMR